MLIAYTTRTGFKITKMMTSAEARKRLEWLDVMEAYTKQVAPTDSGGVRFNYNAEAKAIRDAFGSEAAVEAHFNQPRSEREPTNL